MMKFEDELCKVTRKKLEKNINVSGNWMSTRASDICHSYCLKKNSNFDILCFYFLYCFHMVRVQVLALVLVEAQMHMQVHIKISLYS